MIRVEQSLEQKLAHEARQRELKVLFDAGDIELLYEAAQFLNHALSNQITMTTWLAKEAGENLADAYRNLKRN